MLAATLPIIGREVRTASRRPMDALSALLFFVVVGSVFPLDHPDKEPVYVYERRIGAKQGLPIATHITRDGSGATILADSATHSPDYRLIDYTLHTNQLGQTGSIHVDRDQVSFRLREGDRERPEDDAELGQILEVVERIEESPRCVERRAWERRAEREPKKVASNGSTFKNPPNDFAGRLIEAAGCKGWREGDAVCSPVHANWLVNTGRATASQLLAMIDRVRAEVRRVHGLELELEVKLLGDDA